MAENEEESWAQTLITVTPEDDAVVRTITGDTIVSSSHDTVLSLGVDSISDRRPVVTIRQDFIDSEELEEKRYSDVECQTFLQGYPKVELPRRYKDEATQTMFIGRVCPALDSFRNIINRMNDEIIPMEKRTRGTRTVLTFGSSTWKDDIVDKMSSEIPEEIIQEESEDGEGIVMDSLRFVVDRVFWLSDSPGPPKTARTDAETQTMIKYDAKSGKILIDMDTQTVLTCEPKSSHTKLLNDYLARKGMMRDILDECLEKRVYPRMIVDSVVEDLVHRCADRIRYPSREEAVQTLARCNILEDKDDEVLRNLRRPVLVDTMESSIVVLPLIEELVENSRIVIRSRAPRIVGNILVEICNKSVLVSHRLQQIRSEATGKPLDYVFAARRRRLEESMRKKTTTKNSSAQTDLAGVPEIGKLREPEERVCSTCTNHSECLVCNPYAKDEEEDEKESQFQTKMLHTRDILMTYNPCYVVATRSEQLKNPELTIPCEKKLIGAKKTLSPDSSSCGCSSRATRECRLGDRPSRKKKKFHLSRDSLNDWTRAVDKVTSRAWSLDESSSVGNEGERRSESTNSNVTSSPAMSMKALDILKSTFQSEEARDYPSMISNDQSNSGRRVRSCCPCESIRGEKSPSERNVSKAVKNPETNGVRVIPIVARDK